MPQRRSVEEGTFFAAARQIMHPHRADFAGGYPKLWTGYALEILCDALDLSSRDAYPHAIQNAAV